MTSRYVGRITKEPYRGSGKPLPVKAGTDMSVYRGYIPEGLPQHKPPNRIKWYWKVIGKPRHDLYPKPIIEGFSEEAEYPALSEGSFETIKAGMRQQFRDEIRQQPSVQQKFYSITRPMRHYVANFKNFVPHYNSLPMILCMTRTHLIKSMPESYTSNKSTATEIEHISDGETISSNSSLSELESLVKDIVLAQIEQDRYEAMQNLPSFLSKSSRTEPNAAHKSNFFIQNLVGRLKTALALDANPQLLEYQVDMRPAVRSWWYHSGFPPPNDKVYYKSKKDEDGNVNLMLQVNGSAAMNFRSDSFFEPIVKSDDPLLTDENLVDKFPYPLRNYDGIFKFKWPVSLPGYWYGHDTRFDFPHTTFLTADCLKRSDFSLFNVVNHNDDEECLTGQAVLSSFAWLNGLSSYHGYTPFQELDYPFTGQAISTDGQNWLFNVYQMNGHSFHSDMKAAAKNNICWTSGLMKLYERYENGRFEGINDDVIKLLVKFLSRKTSPEYTAQLNLKPDLREDLRPDEEKEEENRRLRRYIEQRYNRTFSNCWHVPLYEKIFFRRKDNRNRITWCKQKPRRWDKFRVDSRFGS